MGSRYYEGQCAGPPNPDLLARQKTGFLADFFALESRPLLGLDDGAIFPKSYFKKSVSISAMKGAALKRAPLRGTINVLLVLMDFQDLQMAIGAKERFEDLFFSTGKWPTGSVKEYYEEVSGGKISFAGEVLGPFMLSHDKAFYANKTYGKSQTPPNAKTMADEAVTATIGKINFNKYDSDGNGYVDAFCVVHAGTGADESGEKDDIWPCQWVLEQERQVNDVKVYSFLTISEDAKLGVCAHEMGHLLFGWPDLYDTDLSSAGIGNWCLMSYGSWGGRGNCPVHPSAWCKAQQGWIDVSNETENHSITILDVKSNYKAHRLWKNGDTSSQEYFLLENRQLTGFDASLPASGLLVWHIDDAVDYNENEWHPKVRLLQADGSQQLESKRTRGDTGDPFPGRTNNTTFNATSNPNSKSYSGMDTDVSITKIPANSASMTVDITVKAITPLRNVFNPKIWYRLTTTKADYALGVINNDTGKARGLLQISRISNFTGQFWQMVPNGADTYALRTLLLGPTRQLDGYDFDELNPHLEIARPYSGQIWKIAPWGDGTWHLENLCVGKDLYLDTMEGSPQVTMNQASVGRPMQRWTITPIRAITEAGF